MDSIKEYGEIFEKLQLTELSVTEGDFNLTLKRELPRAVLPVSALSQAGEASNVNVSTNALKGESAENLSQSSNMEEVKAPLLGIFHMGTEGTPVLKEGDPVQKGEVLCAIEAMKMFNEITAPVDGVLRKTCVQDGDLVEYKQSLFLIEKAH